VSFRAPTGRCPASLARANLQGADLERTNLAEVRNWRSIAKIDGARILGIQNAPEGFREWALENGATEGSASLLSEPAPAP
jgi:hypothetical protein